jgi:hypothetical protein
MSTTRSLGAVAAEVSGMELSDNQRAMLAWAERFIEKNPPPPLNERQREVLSTLGECMPSLAQQR